VVVAVCGEGSSPGRARAMRRAGRAVACSGGGVMARQRKDAQVVQVGMVVAGGLGADVKSARRAALAGKERRRKKEKKGGKKKKEKGKENGEKEKGKREIEMRRDSRRRSATRVPRRSAG